MTDLQALKLAIETIRNESGCDFQFCPGHRKPLEDMATCRRCRALYVLNKHMRERKKRARPALRLTEDVPEW